MIYYIYDASSNVIGLKYNNDIYYYEKNIQNDITGIMDDSFNLLATYEYDSWGNILSIKDTNGNTITDSSNIALVNPFRYRSYYYDSEIGMYYLNSRYYNQEWGRFINADKMLVGASDLPNYNLYAYTNNNPINKVDEDGNYALPLAIATLVGAVVIFAVLIQTAAKSISASLSKVSLSSTKYSSKKSKESKKDESTEKGSHNVYVLRDSEQKVQYVGRTNNVDAPVNRHKNNLARSNLRMEVIYPDITKEQARVLEQAYIFMCNTLNKENKMNNQINGLSPNYENIELYIGIGQTFLNEKEVYVKGCGE